MLSVPAGVSLLLTGITFPRPGRSRALVGAPGESRKGLRGALGSPGSSFGGQFRPSAGTLGTVLINFLESLMLWEQFGASRRSCFCDFVP